MKRLLLLIFVINGVSTLTASNKYDVTFINNSNIPVLISGTPKMRDRYNHERNCFQFSSNPETTLTLPAQQQGQISIFNNCYFNKNDISVSALESVNGSTAPQEYTNGSPKITKAIKGTISINQGNISVSWE